MSRLYPAPPILTPIDSDVRYAGFWRRIGAGLIDVIPFLPLIWVTAFLDGYSLQAAIVGVIINYSLYYVYVLPLTHRYGGTLGKLAVGIRVTPVDGGTLTWGHVWRRSAVDLGATAVLIAGAVIGLNRIPYATYANAAFFDRPALLDSAVPWYPFVNGIYGVWLMSEFLVLLLNRRRRALHDFIAGTVVVVAPRRDSSQ